MLRFFAQHELRLICAMMVTVQASHEMQEEKIKRAEGLCLLQNGLNQPQMLLAKTMVSQVEPSEQNPVSQEMTSPPLKWPNTKKTMGSLTMTTMAPYSYDYMAGNTENIAKEWFLVDSMSFVNKVNFLLSLALVACAISFVVCTYQRIQDIREPEVVANSQPKEPLISLNSAANVKCNIGPPCNFPRTSLVEQFRCQADKAPQHVALVAWSGSQRTEITYGQLLTKITRIGRQLFSLSLKKGDFCALVLDRGIHQVVSIYSVMLCGAAWVPIDPEVPRVRFENMLVDLNARLLLYQKGFENIASWASCKNYRTVEIAFDAADARSDGIMVQESNASFPTVDSADTAAIFYTSGSTGKPKGVVYSHSQLNNGANIFCDDFNVGPKSVGLLKSSYIWAVFEYEVFPTLIRGGRLVISSATGHKDAVYLAELISSEQVSTLCITPKVLNLLLDVHADGSQLRNLRDVVMVGEALPVQLANRFVKSSNLTARLYNCYGATESSTVFYAVPPCGVDTKIFPTRCPVGSPQAGASVWVLNENHEQEVNDGEEGEICFGGQLADGYWGDPQSTSAKFIHTSQWGKLYCTGDSGRFTGSGLEVVGRVDRQVKIRGVRVEPEEVEASIKNFQQMTSSLHGVAVVASSDPSELVAFVSPKVDSSILDQIEAHCKATLPVYYVPAYYFAVDEFPMLPNGKTDLRVLSEQANSQIQEGVQVLDSLGMMQQMSREAIAETQVIHRCYAFWMVATVASHWYVCGLMSATCILLYPAIVPPWVELFVRQWVGGNQCMFGFILLGAFQDSRPRPGENSPLIHLNYKDLFMYLIFLVMAFPLPQTLYAILGESVIYEQAQGIWCGFVAGHRWYLLMVLISRFILYCSHRLNIPYYVQIFASFAVVILGPPFAIDPCASTNLPIGIKFLLAWGLAPQLISEAACPIFYSWIWAHVAWYIVAFHFSRPALRLLLDFIHDKYDGPLSACLAFGSYMLVCGTMAAFHYIHYNLNLTFRDFWTKLSWLPLEFSASALQAALLPLAMTMLPLNLKWWGSTCLGTYVFHFYLDPRFLHLHDILQLCPAQGFIKLLVLIAIPVIFATTFGPIGHFALTLQWMPPAAQKAVARCTGSTSR